MTRQVDYAARLIRRLRGFGDSQTPGSADVDLVALSGARARPSALRHLCVAAALMLAMGAGCTVSTPHELLSPVPDGIPSSTSPAVQIVGDVPPGDARAPTGATYIAGLQAEDVWQAFASSGYRCTSVASATPDTASGWTIYCDRVTAGLNIAVQVPYWTLENVAGVYATILPEPVESTIGDPSLVLAQAELLVSLDYDGSSVDRGLQWVADSLSDHRCRDVACQATVGQAQISVQAGERGSATIRVDGQSVAP